MAQLLRSSLRVARREWGRLIEQKGVLLLMFGIPLLLFPVAAGIYVHGVVREMPVAVFDADRSELSRMTIRYLDATSAFQVVESAESIDEIQSLFRQGRIKAAFAIPEGMERDVKRGESSEVVVYNDATNLILANMTLKEASTVVKTVSAGIAMKQLRARGMGEDAARRAVMPIRIQTQSLYNPTYNYADYLVTGLIPALFQLTVMIVSVLLICGEEADGTFGQLVGIAQGSAASIVFGKAIPYVLCNLATSMGILWALYPLFGINVFGSSTSLLLLCLLFIAASLSVGLFISSVARDRMLATEVALFINLPAFIISGYIYPSRAMPWPYVAFAHLLPYTHFLDGFVTVGRMGLPLTNASSAIWALLVLIAAGTTGSVLMVRRRAGFLQSASIVTKEEI